MSSAWRRTGWLRQWNGCASMNASGPNASMPSTARCAKETHMNDEHAHLPEPGTLVFRRVLPGPVERVWAFLVEPEKRRLWLAGGEMEPRPGGKVALHFRHAELSP